ncbi:DUF6544 family protein [Hymenobacter swuensis]|nr:DUF6544 family protein [Hymenobacter swuensis]
MKTTTKVWLTAATLGAAGAAVLVSRALAARQLRQDVRDLFAGVIDAAPRHYHEAQLIGLPAPVQRYFRRVLPDGQPYLRGVRLRHTGQFKTDLDKGWVDIAGEQYIMADPPAFIWQGTSRQFTARDEFVDGHGRLRVRLLGAVPIVDGTGPHFDQGELLRWLSECAFLPTALLPSERLQWSAIDEHSARLTLTYGGQTLQYLFSFDHQGELVQCETQRYQGENQLLPWRGRFSDYQQLHGVRVPTLLEGMWVLDGQERPYARFTVQELHYEPLEPF